MTLNHVTSDRLLLRPKNSEKHSYLCRVKTASDSVQEHNQSAT